MIVCVCHRVNDRAVSSAIEGGARTVHAVGRATRAGTDCGACACDIRRLIAESQSADGREGEARVELLAAK